MSLQDPELEVFVPAQFAPVGGVEVIAEAIIEAASAPDANNNNRRVVEGETQEEEPSVESH